MTPDNAAFIAHASATAGRELAWPVLAERESEDGQEHCAVAERDQRARHGRRCAPNAGHVADVGRKS